MAGALQGSFPRRKIDRPIGVLYKGRYALGRIEEISEGGLCINCHLPLNPQDQFVATFRTFKRDWVSVLTTVESQEGESYLVNFENLPFQSRRQIRNLVASTNKTDNT